MHGFHENNDTSDRAQLPNSYANRGNVKKNRRNAPLSATAHTGCDAVAVQLGLRSSPKGSLSSRRVSKDSLSLATKGAA
jgi:hypothetical protein